jgi:riboflavin synthase
MDMFTGIIEHVGLVKAADPRPEGGARFAIDLGPLAEGLRVGDSVAVSGCCLTVVTLSGSVAGFDVIAESIARTWLGELRAGMRVNLERALRLGARLDGHIVQGHVDGVARIVSREESRGEVRLEMEADARLVADMVEKGSVALDGVSLTLTHASLAPGDARGRFGVALIPHTLAVTTLGDRRPGDPLDVETDVLGKWVRRLVAPYLPARAAAGP